MAMIEVAKLELGTLREVKLHDKYDHNNIPIEQWEPIIVNGFNVIDGAQRVLIARKYGILYIPYKTFHNT